MKRFAELNYRMDWPAFVIAVRCACLDLNIKLQDLADEVGITRASLYGMLDGSGGMSAPTMLALCSHLGVDPMQFVHQTEEAA